MKLPTKVINLLKELWAVSRIASSIINFTILKYLLSLVLKYVAGSGLVVSQFDCPFFRLASTIYLTEVTQALLSRLKDLWR